MSPREKALGVLHQAEQERGEYADREAQRFGGDVLNDPTVHDAVIRISHLVVDAYAPKSPGEPETDRRARAIAVWLKENELT